MILTCILSFCYDIDDRVRLTLFPWKLCLQLSLMLYSLLPTLGGHGSSGVKHTESWSAYTKRLLNSMHAMLNDLYEKAPTGLYWFCFIITLTNEQKVIFICKKTIVNLALGFFNDVTLYTCVGCPADDRVMVSGDLVKLWPEVVGFGKYDQLLNRIGVLRLGLTYMLR